MAYWLPGVDTLCSTAGRGAILFGEDSLSGCYMELGLQNFTNCTTLREEMVTVMDSLSQQIALVKMLQSSCRDSDWIQVLRQDSNDTQFVVPAPLDELNMSRVADTLTGQCSNMISSVHLEIMYAETGRSNGEPIYEIVGVYRKYSVSNWELSCGSGYTSCSVDSYTEKFLVTSTVRFIKGPANPPVAVTLFEYTHIQRSVGQMLLGQLHVSIDLGIHCRLSPVCSGQFSGYHFLHYFIPGLGSAMVPNISLLNHSGTKSVSNAEDSPLFSKTDGASQKKKKRVTFAVQLENVRPLVFDIAATVSEEAVLARHGPYLLTATDFRSLLDKNWLTDN
ncbi:hypothetical protein ScPMuIL_006865 [Solemya velum]